MSSYSKKRTMAAAGMAGPSGKIRGYSFKTGYDRSRGGLQPGSRVSLMAALRQRNAATLKGVDTSLSLSPVIATTSTNASSFLLNAIAPGSGSFNRVGRKVILKSLRIKGGFTFTFTPNASGAVSEQGLRMVIVWDKQPNSGTIPTWDVIFGNTDQAGTESSSVASPLRYDNMERFQVLKDKCVDCPIVAGNVVSTAALSQYISVDDYLSLNNRETSYSGQSATCTIADISTGALYVYFRAQNNAATTVVAVDADTTARLRYLD